jgi:hypothetical protein
MSNEAFPILLIDCSGSTEHNVNIPYFKNVNTILKYQIELAKKIFTTKNIQYVYVIMWSYTARICSKLPILVSELTKIKQDSVGGTELAIALTAIPQEWISNNNNNKQELYIFTDGEIENENQVVAPLKQLIDSGITIQIVTVEPNNINYVQNKGEAGYKLFQVIKNNGLTTFVRRFSSYNEHHVLEPFISFDNPEEIEGFTPFCGKYYNINEEYDELLDTVEEKVKICTSVEEIAKLAHETTVTISHIVKNKSTEDHTEITSQIADIFAESNIAPTIFNQVNQMLLLETAKQSTGNGSIYQEFKDALILKI